MLVLAFVISIAVVPEEKALLDTETFVDPEIESATASGEKISELVIDISELPFAMIAEPVGALILIPLMTI